MKFLAVLASLVATANAFCPNLCSGHGKCGNQDTCACYTYSGTTRGDNVNYYEIADQRAAWTGADCSLRTCPLAFSWSGTTPYGLSLGLTVAVTTNTNTVAVTLSAGQAAWYTALAGKTNSFSTGQKLNYEGALYTVLSASLATTTLTIKTYEKITSAGTATTAYFEPLESDTTASAYDTVTLDYSQWDANGAHGLSECAGQGLCDRTTGQCNCFPGYEGEACTRTVCPNGCSGHGTCIEAYRLQADFGNTYTMPWDAKKSFGCKCDTGFRGPDCSLQECPSDYDPLNGCGGGRCNNGGTYTQRDGTTGTCPNNAVSVSTINNVVIQIGTSDCATKEQRDCSGRGVCDYSSGTCKCFSGFFGESCNIQTVLV